MNTRYSKARTTKSLAAKAATGCLGLAGLLLLPGTALGQEQTVTVEVIVEDSYTAAALPSADVGLYHGNTKIASATTNVDGRAVLSYQVTSTGPGGPRAEGLHLGSNYPNPFDRETRIDLALQDTGPVNIGIYDLIGRRVLATRLDLEAGEHALLVDLGHLPAGVYVLRIEGAEARSTRMVKTGAARSGGPARISVETRAVLGPSAYARAAGAQESYRLQIELDRYEPVQVDLQMAADTSLTTGMDRLNRVVFTVRDESDVDIVMSLSVTRGSFSTTVTTQDTVTLKSGRYQVSGTSGDLSVAAEVEVPSIDLAPVLHAEPVSAGFDIHPTEGPPGAVVRVTDLDLSDHALEDLSLWIGGELVPFIVEGEEILGAFPLFLGEDAWPQPPASPVWAEIRHGEQLLWRSRQQVTITELLETPGTTEEVKERLEEIAQAYIAILESLPLPSEYSPALNAAIAGMLHGLISEGEYSLGAVLEQKDPDLSLADALLASSGALDDIRLWAEALTEAEEDDLARAAGFFRHCRGEGDDFALACLMQIQSLLDDYTKAFLTPTARTWANTVGRINGLIAISGVNIPGSRAVGALLEVLDFVFTKIVPAVLPSQIESLELEVAQDVVSLDFLTTSQIHITAANDPPPITVTDVVELIVTGLGLRGGTKAADAFGEYLFNAAVWGLGIYNEIMKAHIEASGLSPIDEFRIPPREWGPTQIRHADLVELFSYDESVIRGEDEPLEWRGRKVGTNGIRAQTRGAGSRSKVLLDHRLCLGCRYSGGAFGTDVASTSTIPITVVDLWELRHDGRFYGLNVILGERAETDFNTRAEAFFDVDEVGIISGQGHGSVAGVIGSIMWGYTNDDPPEVYCSMSRLPIEFDFVFSVSGVKADGMLEVHAHDVDLLGASVPSCMEGLGEVFMRILLAIVLQTTVEAQDGALFTQQSSEAGPVYDRGEEIGWSEGESSWANAVFIRHPETPAQFTEAGRAATDSEDSVAEALRRLEQLRAEGMRLHVSGLPSLEDLQEAAGRMKARP
jgi:hypothetical protein